MQRARHLYGALSKMHLIFDFDGTMTARDTVGHLAAAAISAQTARGAAFPPGAWDGIVSAYLADYDAYKASFTPKESERRSLDQEKRFLAGVRDAERASLRRVSEAGVFKGLDATAMRRLGADAVRDGDVKLRNGLGRLVSTARERGCRVSVVSVNWSAAFIRGVAGDVLREEDTVVANTTREGDGRILGPEELEGELLVCSPDKLRVMRRVLDGGEEGEEVVYFGDSTTDLECLVGANRGVVLADNEESSLLKTLRRVGVSVRRVGEGNGGMVWAKSFDEVLGSRMLD